MLLTKEHRDDRSQKVTTFMVGETVHVVSLNRTGKIVGMEGGRWLVRLTEGDAPVPCDSGNLQKRQTLMG